MKIRRVKAPRCLVGEGPVWDVAEQALYYLDITGRKIHRHAPATGANSTWETPTSVGALALREGGGAALAMRDKVYGLDFAAGGFELLATADQASARATFNDGKVDRRGRFVIGLCDTDMSDPQPIGGLYSLGADHRLRGLDTGICFSNSPCFAPDDRTLYFADSHEYALYAYDYDIETGDATGRRVLVDTRELGGMPDGATVDRDGLIWMAIFRGHKVVALRPDGKVERIVDMPVSMAVSVSFGGPDLDQLYVTTIDPQSFGEPAEDGAGDLYVIESLGVRGLPEPRYAG